MVRRVYMMPREPVSLPAFPGKTPKHAIYAQAIHNAGGSIVDSTWWPGYCLVLVDGPDVMHDALKIAPRCRQLPANLNNQVGGALAVTQSTLEAVHMPADWVTATMTWKQVLAGVRRIASFYQTMWGSKLRGLIGNGRTLSTTWSELPAAVKQKINAAADRRNLDKSGVTASTTLRQLLVLIGSRIVLKREMGDG